MTPELFDLVVIGGGHAGAEAAWAGSHLLAGRGRVALITMDPLAIGRMSCNPAIGGLAKGQMVREIDALGGLMAHAIDATGIQFRMLNRSKGPAVQSPRAQADKYAYALAVQKLLATHCPNLTIIPGIAQSLEAQELPDSRRRITGVALESGRRLTCSAVVVTTGTFLRGLMHTGEAQTRGGRVDEASAEGLSASLIHLGLELGRLKTGTPPRLDRDSLDLAGLQLQPGDDPPIPFSDLTGTPLSPLAGTFPAQPQVPCYITWTTPQVHDLIRANLHRAPMYSGQIQSRGPRYCPSIEDKVVRFADKTQHQVFLEPESLQTNEIYCNGISTSLPREIQEQIVRGIPGLEKARILRWGYAVEYDFSPTHQITASLETRKVEGLFLAGQINGTSGYEEAAAQGLIAGLNAARKIQQLDPLILTRDQAYIGVMIDDLITKTPTEPYRMFTSRAEFRLTLRSDNTDQRLTPLGAQVGLASPARLQRLEKKLQKMARVVENFHKVKYSGGLTAYDFLRRPNVEWHEIPGAVPSGGETIAAWLADSECRSVIEQVQVEARYCGYIEREKRTAEKMIHLESKRIPLGFDFDAVVELRKEAREALKKFRPTTLGQASRLEGITPSDLTVVLIHLR